MHYLYRVEQITDDPSAAIPWFPPPSTARTQPSDDDIREELREHIMGESADVDDDQSDSDEIQRNRGTRYYTCTTESPDVGLLVESDA